jgi:hypothetical protein
MAPCSICRGLQPDAGLFEEAVLRSRNLTVHIIASLHELQESSQNECILCSIIHQAGSQFAERFWKKYNPKCARLDFSGQTPWYPPANVSLTLEGYEKGSEEGQKVWRSSRPTGTKKIS